MARRHESNPFRSSAQNPYAAEAVRVGVVRRREARIRITSSVSFWHLIVPSVDGPPRLIEFPPKDIEQVRGAMLREEILYLCTLYEPTVEWASLFRDCSFYLFRNEVWSAAPMNNERWTNEQSHGMDPDLVAYIRKRASALPAAYNGVHWSDRDPFLLEVAEEKPLRSPVAPQVTAGPQRRMALMDYPVAYPEWEVYEQVEPPDISWTRAKRAVATTTDLDPFVTIRSWGARSRWLFGWHNNMNRINRLRSTKPHGFDPDGDPWYAALLYPAPPDPVYEHDNLVGVVGWMGAAAASGTGARP